MNLVAIGNFDGVHRGHHALLTQLGALASATGLTPTVVTFSNHPLTVIRPEVSPKRLTDSEEREKLLRQSGVEKIFTLRFDENLRRMTAREFVEMVKREYDAGGILFGFNNHIGSDRVTSREALKAIGEESGVEIFFGKELSFEGQPVSSTIIRSLLESGSMEEAMTLLGRPYTVKGVVVKGEQLGRQLGFPTANLEISSDIALPGNGVYRGEIELDCESRACVINIGTRPTVSGKSRTVEVHIPTFEGNLYGKRLRVKFIEKLRDEKKFESLEALRDAIERDVETVKGKRKVVGNENRDTRV